MRGRGRGPHSRPSSRGLNSPRAFKSNALNCFIDETVLTEGARGVGETQLTSWLTARLIRLYVPLYTLDKLNSMSIGFDDGNDKARAALQWLDQISTSRPNHVIIQETGQAFDEGTALDRYRTRKVISTANADGQPRTPPQSPSSRIYQTVADEIDGQVSALSISPDTVPADTFQSLFSHIIWRIYKDPSSSSDVSTYTLLTNDSKKATIASTFGIGGKSLIQMDHTIATSDQAAAKAFRTPESSQEITSQSVSDSEEEILLKRGTSPPPTLRTRPNEQHSPRQVIDPNDFTRRDINASGRGRRGGRHRQTNSRDRIQMPPRSPVATTTTPAEPTQIIDPDSFDRPKPSRGRGRGRLWEPS